MKLQSKSVQQKQEESPNDISRKEALKKLGKYGKYSALMAMGSFVVLNPKKAQATSHDC